MLVCSAKLIHSDSLLPANIPSTGVPLVHAIQQCPDAESTQSTTAIDTNLHRGIVVSWINPMTPSENARGYVVEDGQSNDSLGILASTRVGITGRHIEE